MKILLFLTGIFLATSLRAETSQDIIRDMIRDMLQNESIVSEAYRQESQAKTDYLRHLQNQDVFDRIRAGRYGYVMPPGGIYVNPQNTMRVDNPVSGFNDNLLERLFK